MRKCNSCDLAYEGASFLCPQCKKAPLRISEFATFCSETDKFDITNFDEHTYQKMSKFEKDSFYIKSRFDLIYWCFRNYFNTPQQFLDFGGGTGFWLEQLSKLHPNIELFGTDLSIDSLHNMRRRLGSRAEIIHCDANNLPFENHFDLVGSFDVIEHIEDDLNTLCHLRSALSEKGGLIVTVPQHMCLWSILDVKTGHKRRYVGDELATKVRKAGFEILLDTCFMASLFIPQLISRKFMHKCPNSEPDMEHSLPHFINSIFRILLKCELLLIKVGVRFPFGGLRIVVAKKVNE